MDAKFGLYMEDISWFSWFPAHCGEVVQCDAVSCSLDVLKDEGEGPEMFLVFFTKISDCLHYVFHCTPWLITSVSVYNSPFLVMLSFFIGDTKSFLIVLAPLR